MELKSNELKIALIQTHILKNSINIRKASDPREGAGRCSTVICGAAGLLSTCPRGAGIASSSHTSLPQETEAQALSAAAPDASHGVRRQESRGI